MKIYFWPTVPPEAIPKAYRPADFTSEPAIVSWLDVEKLSDTFDVAVVHGRDSIPSRKERARGILPTPGETMVWVDVKGGQFKWR